MTLNESALRKTVFLLLCTALLTICIDSAAAVDSPDQSSSPLATATQAQGGYISVNNGAVSYGLGQQQSAEISNGDGTITQDTQSYSNVKSNGKVTKITEKQIGIQNVDLASSDGSTNTVPGSTDNTGNTNTAPGSTDDTGNTNTAPGSTDNNAPNKVKIKFTVPNGDSASVAASQSIAAYQEQTETSSEDINQEQIGILKIKITPKKVKGVIILKQK
jgi:hypothetical protein